MARKKADHGAGEPKGAIVDVAFHEEARRRYLNYALSVITTRAIPDVRDGLKPVQRRILFTMHRDLHLHADSRPQKCAAVVGGVLARYHPHGDTAVYDALVRLAQPWSLRYPLVDGHGNFGSLDGDPPAAYRYTEARLQRISAELLEDLGKDTVDFRDNFDGNHREPCVLPARIPQLLLNGTTGIAVGLATSVPPHNLKEVVEACVALIDDRALTVAGLMKHIKGPDFPVGGQVLNSRADLRKIYEEGQGSIRVRAEYEVEDGDRGSQRIVVRSLPYLAETDKLVQRIAEVILSRKVSQMVDVRNESTEKDGVRIVIELKKESDPALVMAYLYRNTPLQATFPVNLTCLVPAREGKPPIPQRLDLKSMLTHFLDFRYQVVERRFQYELRLLKERIHVLEGFRKLFDALDEAIRLIRGADGKQDAAEKLIRRFHLDAVQAEAILELKLYKLAKLEIKAILEELKEKRTAAKEIEEILSSKRRLWTVVKREIQETVHRFGEAPKRESQEIGQRFGEARRTRIGGATEDEEYDEEAFIADEDATVILSRDGWVRRVQRIGDLSKVRLRQDDELLTITGGNTREAMVFFSNFGTAYTVRINDIPPSPHGFGDPVQRLFRFRDGERVVAAASLDPRLLGGDASAIGKARDKAGTIPKLHALAVSSAGYGLRFGLLPLAEPSTRAGRRFSRVREGEEVVDVALVRGDETLVTATREGRALLCAAKEVNFLAGPGRGVKVMKVAKEDRVIGFAVGKSANDGLTVVRDSGKAIPILLRSYKVASRGGKGFEVIKQGKIEKVKRPPVELPEFLKPEASPEAEGRAPRPEKGARAEGPEGAGGTEERGTEEKV